MPGFEVPVPDLPLPATGPRALAGRGDRRPGGSAAGCWRRWRTAPRPDDQSWRSSAPGARPPEAFPSEDVLAGVIASAAAVNAPLKLTAGLHHAVRFTDRATGFEHHGFLNVLVAVSQALRRSAIGRRSRSMLALRDGAELGERLRKLAPDQVRRVRQRFVSFGCCGVEDPVADLVALGLVQGEE